METVRILEILDFKVKLLRFHFIENGIGNGNRGRSEGEVKEAIVIPGFEGGKREGGGKGEGIREMGRRKSGGEKRSC
jgi:hypothetical protein